jgi:hypothetical protein
MFAEQELAAETTPTVITTTDTDTAMGMEERTGGVDDDRMEVGFS